jgi:hypothetical protein
MNRNFCRNYRARRIKRKKLVGIFIRSEKSDIILKMRSLEFKGGSILFFITGALMERNIVRLARVESIMALS